MRVFRVGLVVLMMIALVLTMCGCGDKKTETAVETTEAPAEATEAPTEEATEAPTEEATEAPAEEVAEATETAAEETTTEETTTEETAVETANVDLSGVELTVFNCYDYIDPDVIDIFEQETGAKVVYVNYTTNEEMYTKLEAGAANYDVIFPSDYMIERLISEDRLEKLDMANIPNAAGLIDWMKTPDYDSEGAYSVPYMWGTFGILYNIDMTGGEIDSWDALFDEKYKGNVFMMNSQRDTIAIALLKLGYDINTRDEGQMNEAKELLIAQRKAGIPAGYMLDEIKDKMVGNEAAMGIVYSGDAIYAMKKNDKLRYVVPKEGGNVWVDGACIPKGSKNKAAAEAFINFLCREDIAAKNIDYIGYCTPIQAVADAQVSDNALLAEVMNPSDEVIARCTFFHDVTDVMAMYEEVWMAVLMA